MAGRSPVSVFYQDALVLGPMTIGPVTEGHAMVIPRSPVASLADLDEATGRHLWTVTQRAAVALQASGLRCEGVNLFLADGAAAFQEIFHVHMHLFPRYRGAPFKLVADWDNKPPRADLDRVAAQLRPR